METVYILSSGTIVCFLHSQGLFLGKSPDLAKKFIITQGKGKRTNKKYINVVGKKI